MYIFEKEYLFLHINGKQCAQTTKSVPRGFVTKESIETQWSTFQTQTQQHPKTTNLLINFPMLFH